MNQQITREEVRALRSDRQRVADLITDYPKLSEAEVQEILTFLRTAPHLDVGLLTSSDRLRPKLDAFMEEHKHHFRVNWREATLLIAAIAGVLALLWLAWELFN